MLLTSCATERLRNERLARFVDEVVFGGPIDQHVPMDNRLTKWTDGLRVVVTGIEADKYRPRVAGQLERLAHLSGLDLGMTDDKDAAHITFSLVKNENFLINREYVECYAHVESVAGRIRQAKVELSVARPERIDLCIQHEFLHALGLRYHSGIARSVLSPAHGEDAMTPWDELALQVLYDPRLEPGTEREEVLPVMREIVSDLLAKP